MTTNMGCLKARWMVLAAVAATWAFAADAASGKDPLTAFVGLGGTYDDNLYDLDSGANLGPAQPFADVDDWYGNIEAGFESDRLASLPVNLQGRIYRQEYGDTDDLDHTGGRFDATADFKGPGQFKSDIGYRFDRRLQDFLNQLVPTRNLIEENRLNGGIERTLGLRSRIRTSARVRDLEFSQSDFLDKKMWDADVHYEYAASRRSRFGLLISYENSDFDLSNGRDYSGWFVGPTLGWQATDTFRLDSNLGWTERELDDPREGLSDFDGVTGTLSMDWDPGDFSLKASVFRDVSNLGGETVDYVDRIGGTVEPTWRLAARWQLRVKLLYENRDFAPSLGDLIGREDDYYVAGGEIEWNVNRRIDLFLGYDYEHRTSNEDIRRFTSHEVALRARMNF